MKNEGPEHSERWEKILAAHALAAREVVRTGELQKDFVFWLGRVAERKDPESSLLLDLVLAREITPKEAVSEEPAKWVRMIQDLQYLDGITESPASALKKWRELTPMAQQMIVDRIETERKERIANRRPTEPTARDRARLERGAEAMALGEPETDNEVLEQIEILRDGAVALQSTDDLGSDAANARVHRDMQTIVAKLDRLKARAAKI
jgi:hypothetical protein